MFFVTRGFAQFGPIFVDNPSFEELPVGGLPLDCGPGCTFDDGVIPGWTDNPAFSGQVHPAITGGLRFFNEFAPNNGMVSAFTNGPEGLISQEVGPTVQSGTTYVFTVEIGHNLTANNVGTADLLLTGVGHPPETIDAIGTPPPLGGMSVITSPFN